MSFASPPRIARRSCWRNFSLIGLLPAPDECISHITRLYLTKLKGLRKPQRHRPAALAGSRAFIRAVQQVDACEIVPHKFTISAAISAS
jgi:hypothetical protein